MMVRVLAAVAVAGAHPLFLFLAVVELTGALALQAAWVFLALPDRARTGEQMLPEGVRRSFPKRLGCQLLWAINVIAGEVGHIVVDVDTAVRPSGSVPAFPMSAAQGEING